MASAVNSFDRDKITDLGLKEVAKLQKLIFLDLSDPALPKAQIDQLQKALPKCRIISNPTKLPPNAPPAA